MKELHYHLYAYGNCGMINTILSIENALLLAKSTNRDKIIFYTKQEFVYSQKRINELFFIDYNYEIVYITNDIKFDNALEFDFFGKTALGIGENTDKAFLNGREYYNLSLLSNVDKIYTKNENTLSHYSFLFAYNKQDFDWVNKSIIPNDYYVEVANDIINIIGVNNFNSIHIRRDDYVTVIKHWKNAKIQFSQILEVIKSAFDNKPLFIHTDEKDKSYFNGIDCEHYFVDDIITKHYPKLTSVEVGLVSMIIACWSDDFIGTMLSTFTGFIQRKVYQRTKKSFKFAYSQLDSIKLEPNGEIKSELELNKWSDKIYNEMQGIIFWGREWENSI